MYVDKAYNFQSNINSYNASEFIRYLNGK